MTNFYPLTLAAALSTLTSQVVAEPSLIGYDFATARYTWFSSIMSGFPADIDGRGVTLDLSLDLRPYIALVGNYATGKAHVTSDGATSNADLESYAFGVVIHLPVNDRTDFQVGASFINGKVSVDGPYSGSEDVNGGLSTIGIKSRISDYVEIDGTISRYSTTDTSSISINLSADYFVKEQLSINLGLAKDSQGGAIALGTTKYF
jgi:hypothetical protein